MERRRSSRESLVPDDGEREREKEREKKRKIEREKGRREEKRRREKEEEEKVKHECFVCLTRGSSLFREAHRGQLAPGTRSNNDPGKEISASKKYGVTK
ncbi:hypothetical protein ANTQUA_LOCUS3496 [Anthophora quadrimaculata]